MHSNEYKIFVWICVVNKRKHRSEVGLVRCGSSKYSSYSRPLKSFIVLYLTCY